MLAVQVLRRYIPQQPVSALLQEGLTILGRAMAPGELLLYEWYAFKRDAKLFGSLEKAEVQASPESQDAT